MSSTYGRISHSFMDGKRFNRVIAQHHPHRTDCWAVWSWAILVSTRAKSDGEMFEHQFATVIDADRLAVAVRVLIEVNLFERAEDDAIWVVDFEEHNRTRAQIEELEAKRVRAGSVGGKSPKSRRKQPAKANAKQVLTHDESNSESFAKTPSKPPVSASASAFVSVPDPERATPSPPPDRPPLTVTVADPEDAPAALPNELAAQALVAGYREAYRAEHRGIPPTDADRWSVPAGAREAFWHSTDATKPSELRDHAERVASAWFRSRKSRAHPAFSFFLKDLARLLAEGAGAPPMRLVAVTEPEVADAS